MRSVGFTALPCHHQRVQGRVSVEIVGQGGADARVRRSPGPLVRCALVDVGMGVRSAAKILGLDFIPLQEERYDLVIPTLYLTTHPALASFLDAIVSRPFRTEIEALGGYDTRQTGKMQDLWVKT